MLSFIFFFFNDTATTEIYTLSLHDALPISVNHAPSVPSCDGAAQQAVAAAERPRCSLGGAPVPRRRGLCPRLLDRKSTRLNSSHLVISYAVFCLKKKKKLTI